MRNGLKIAVAAAVMAAGFAAPAMAHDHGHGSFFFYSGPSYAPAYYYPYPYYSTSYYAPAPYPVEGPPAYYAPQLPPPMADNGYCREYQSPVLIGGVRRTTYGTACLQPDGSWKLIN